MAQSEKDKKGTAKKAAHKTPDKPPAMEGEVLESASGLGEGAKDATNQAAASGKPRGASSKASLIFAGVLMVFVGGLFAAPWAEMGLRALFPSLMPAEEAAEDSATSADLAALQASITALEANLARVTERLQGTESAIDATSIQASTNSSQIEALGAASGVADAGDGIDFQALDGLEGRLSAIEANLLELGETTFALESQNTEIQANLETNVEGEDPGAATIADAGANSPNADRNSARLAQIDALETRLGLLEGAVAAALSENPEIRLFPIAVARLARAIEGGSAYEGAMLEVRALVETLPVVDRVLAAERLAELDASALSGITSQLNLNARYGPLAAIAINTEALEEDASWWEGAWASVRGLVSVRRTGDVEGVSDEALLAQAELALEAGDLAAAQSLVGQLTPLARDVFEGWLSDANERLAAQNAMERLIALAFDEAWD